MNKVIVWVLSIGLFVGSCGGMLDVVGNTLYQEKADSLHKTAQRYTDFLAQFGKATTGDLTPQMESLFAADCNKIVNGRKVSGTIPELYAQIVQAKINVGLWTIAIVTPFIISPERNTVVAHYEIPTELQGTLVVIKFLLCNNKGLIKEINEVFNKK